MKHDFRVVQGCPVPRNIAPYIKIVTDDARATVNSIYRGTDAESILHRHGHSSQADLYSGWVRRLPGYLPANPPGYSTHEQKSDGAAYAVMRGHNLAWWQIGFDVNDDDVEKCISAAAKHGWVLFRPYAIGSEYHHLNFRFQPKPKTLRMRGRIIKLRATLPRK
jgi:hypothetical protein